MFESLSKVGGVAYSGGILDKGPGQYVIDIESLDFDDSLVAVKEEHQVVGSIGDAKLILSKDKETGGPVILFEGDIFDYDSDSKRAAHQLSRGHKVQASVGIMPLEEIENFSGEVNGQTFKDVTLLRGGKVKEVSLTIYPADSQSEVGTESFYFCNKAKTKTKTKNKNKKKEEFKNMDEFMSKAQWMEFACACGGNSTSTPRDMERKFQDLQEDSEALAEIKETEVALERTKEELENEIATLKEQIAELSAQLQEYTDAEGVEVETEIEEFSKETGHEFSKEEIEQYKKNPKLFRTFAKIAGFSTKEATEDFEPKRRSEVKSGKHVFTKNADGKNANNVVKEARELQAKTKGLSYSQAVDQVLAKRKGN